MGRNRTATNILDARGAFKKNPQRARKQEPKGNGTFPKSPPRHLDPLEKKCWKEIVKRVPAGVLTSSDVLVVEMVVKLWAEFREDSRSMPTARLTRLSSEMGKLGLSPSDRAKLSIDKKEENDFDDI